MITTTHRFRGGASTIYHLVQKPREEIIYLDMREFEDPDTGELLTEPDELGRKEVRTHKETIETVVDALIAALNSTNSSFDPGHFKAHKRNDHEFIIQASDTMNDNDFYSNVENRRGPGTKVELEVLG